MKLSVITINWNNVKGLEQTMKSVVDQIGVEFEYVVVDGASTDGSVEVIEKYAQQRDIKWVSEKDTGIYNAMNKAVKMATGDYIAHINSGDWFVNEHVLSKLLAELEKCQYPPILFSKIIKVFPDGRHLVSGREPEIYSARFFFDGTLNHPGTLIRRSLFDQYGLYDENLRIVSDWKWFMNVIGINEVKVKHCAVRSLYFDMTGISETNTELCEKEVSEEIRKTLPTFALQDYFHYRRDFRLIDRLHRFPWAFKLVYYLDRILFVYERHKNNRQKE